MKINQGNSNINQNPVLINTLVKQVSDLQIDTSRIENDLNDLESAVNTHITFNRDGDGRTEVNNLASNDISVSKAAIQEANISHLTSANGSIANLTSTSGVIKNLQSTHIDADDANITHLDVESQAHLQDTDVAKSLTVHGLTTTEDIHAKNIESISLHTTDVETTALNAVSGTIPTLNSQNITASNKVTTKDLEITGEITGVSDMEMHDLVANDIKANSADIDKITWIEQILDKTHVIDPSPELSNVDRYTIQLPKFSGWYIITCLGPDNTIKWAATIRGNGYDYSISWSCADTTESIKNLYQYKGQLYIRHSANGTIAFAYSADRDLPDPTIYFNMDGWVLDLDLPDLCDERHKYDVISLNGTIFFGLFVAPGLQIDTEESGLVSFKGSCRIEELHTKLAEAMEGDIWNITNYGYTTSEFVEGEGHPINIDDDVIAVKNDVEGLDVKDLGENDGYDWPFFNDAHWSVEEWIGHSRGIIKTELDGTETTYSVADEISPIRDSKIIKGTNCLLYVTDKAIVRSEDGENWTKVADLYEMAYSLQHDIIKLHNGTLLCIYLYDYYDEDLGDHIRGCQKAISTDDGLTWTITDYPIEADFMPESLIEDNTSVYAYKHNKLWISNDHGDTFTEIPCKANATYYKYGNAIIAVEDDAIYILDKSTMDWESTAWTGDTSKIIGTINILGSSILKVEDNTDNNSLVDLSITYDFGVSWKKLGSLELSNLDNDYHIVDNNIVYENRNIVEYVNDKVLMWDKFAAGVNYEDFRAKKITAEEELISEGTLEVDGDSTFKGNIELDSITSEISATGNLELSVTGTTTETYTGIKTENLTAGKIINGDVTSTGTIDADKLIGHELKIRTVENNVEHKYLEAKSTGVAINVDTTISADVTLNGDLTQTGNTTQTGDYTLTGDLTQTGDQNITGNSTISGVVTIGELD